MGKEVRKICLSCETDFGKPSYLSWAMWKKTKYCSRACSSSAQRKFGSRACFFCGEIFHRDANTSSAVFSRRKFCSLACSTDHQREARLTVPRDAVKTCERCGNEIVRGARSARQWRDIRYCSMSCSAYARWAKDRDEFPTECEICGEIRAVHRAHIIASVDGGPRDRWNTVVLCPTHHACMDLGLLRSSEIVIIRDRIEGAIRISEEIDLDLKKPDRRTSCVLALVSRSAS